MPPPPTNAEKHGLGRVYTEKQRVQKARRSGESFTVSRWSVRGGKLSKFVVQLRLLHLGKILRLDLGLTQAVSDEMVFSASRTFYL
jgi:hypothetical protein